MFVLFLILLRKFLFNGFPYPGAEIISLASGHIIHADYVWCIQVSCGLGISVREGGGGGDFLSTQSVFFYNKFLSLCPPLSVWLWLYHCVPGSLPVSPFQYLFLFSISLYRPLFVFLSLCLSASLCLSVSVSIYLSGRICLNISWTCQKLGKSFYTQFSMVAFLIIYIYIYILIHLFIFSSLPFVGYDLIDLGYMHFKFN